MRLFNVSWIVVASLAIGCESTPPAESPAQSPTVVAYPQNVSYTTNVYGAAGPPTTQVALRNDDVSRIAILPSSKPDRPAEVIGVVDVHEPMANEAAALDALRKKAAALGADAVLGVEFHHGEETGPTHLSGLAVRYTDGIR